MNRKVHNMSANRVRRWALAIAIVVASAIGIGGSQASAGENFRYAGTYQYSGRHYGGHDYSGHDFRSRSYGSHDYRRRNYPRRQYRSHDIVNVISLVTITVGAKRLWYRTERSSHGSRSKRSRRKEFTICSEDHIMRATAEGALGPLFLH